MKNLSCAKSQNQRIIFAYFPYYGRFRMQIETPKPILDALLFSNSYSQIFSGKFLMLFDRARPKQYPDMFEEAKSSFFGIARCQLV